MNTTVNSKDFVVAWVDSYNKGQGIAGVARRTKLEHAQVSAKANSLRNQGVNLPAMPRGRVGFSVEDLNQIIDSRLN